MIKRVMHAGIVLSLILLYSCSAKKITSEYYYQHQKVLEEIERSYKTLSVKRPFTLAFTDKDFRTLSVEIITDSLSYIYDFVMHDPQLNDTLRKYKFDVDATNHLIDLMVSIRCTWINNFDYYVDENKRSCIMVSVKPFGFRRAFSYKKYFVLTFFNQPQRFDEKGRLLDTRRSKRLRQINGETFFRITDKVCYTIAGQFR